MTVKFWFLVGLKARKDVQRRDESEQFIGVGLEKSELADINTARRQMGMRQVSEFISNR